MKWRQVNARGDLESADGGWFARRFFGEQRWSVGLLPGPLSALGGRPAIGEGDTPEDALADWADKARVMGNILFVLADLADDLSAGDAPGKD